MRKIKSLFELKNKIFKIKELRKEEKINFKKKSDQR